MQKLLKRVDETVADPDWLEVGLQPGDESWKGKRAPALIDVLLNHPFTTPLPAGELIVIPFHCELFTDDGFNDDNLDKLKTFMLMMVAAARLWED